MNSFPLVENEVKQFITNSFRLPDRKRVQDFLSTKFNVGNDDIIRDDNQHDFCKLN